MNRSTTLTILMALLLSTVLAACGDSAESDADAGVSGEVAVTTVMPQSG